MFRERKLLFREREGIKIRMKSPFFGFVGHGEPTTETKKESQERRKETPEKGQHEVSGRTGGSESDWGPWDRCRLLAWPPAHVHGKAFLAVCGRWRASSEMRSSTGAQA